MDNEPHVCKQCCPVRREQRELEHKEVTKIFNNLWNSGIAIVGGVIWFVSVERMFRLIRRSVDCCQKRGQYNVMLTGLAAFSSYGLYRIHAHVRL